MYYRPSPMLPPPPPPQKIDPAAKMNFEYHQSEVSTTVLTDNAIVQKGGVVGEVHDNVSSPFNSFPPGIRFKPEDDELINHYLKKKVLNQKLPMDQIPEVDLYKHDPEYLTAKYPPCGEIEWYFFTPGDRKHKKGNRPNRVAENGYWKPIGVDKQIHSNGRYIGDKKTLVFYSGMPPNGEKTNWIMQEFWVKQDSNCQTERGSNNIKLDNWVLCKIYRRPRKSPREVHHAEIPREEEDTSMEDNDGSDDDKASIKSE